MQKAEDGELKEEIIQKLQGLLLELGEQPTMQM
jgi:hypothetical protein